jgi:glucose-1-phosphate thymidylyltransferase
MKAVVLARGLGTRMRASDPDARLSDGQRAAADAGLKAMIPVNGRPFLDYVLGALADAGVAEVGLVVAPDHDEVRRHYAKVPPARIDLSFVVQAEARGTADAVLAAASWTNGEPFLAMNADNLYPVVALAQLAALQEPGLLAFERDDLVRTGNIPADRVQSFAVLDVDADGYLARIVEKPASLDHHEILVSMNCWRFDSRIFDACGAVPRSPRGEFELPEAAALATARGMRFRVLRVAGPVLDLSRRADMADVERRLAGVEPRP